MKSFRSLIVLVIMLVTLQQQQKQSVEAKALNSMYQVKFRRLPPKEFSAALGSSITIECEAGASPPATIHWLKDGKRIYMNEMDANQLEDFDQSSGAPVDDVNRIALSATRSRLYIDCADLSDEATYTCVAENAYSRISSHSKLNLIRPAVQSASVVASSTAGGDENDLSNQQQQQQQQASSSGNLDLALAAVPQCLSDRLTARSAPQAPVRIHMWTHSIVEIMKNNVIIYCRSNVLPSVSKQTTAISQQEQQSSSVTPTRLSAAPTEVAQSNQNVNIKPVTVWTLPDDKPVSADQKDKYEVLDTGDLLIKDLRWSDMGNYLCTVSDERGSDSVSTFVYPAAVKVNSKRSASKAAAALANWNLNIR